MSAEARLKLRNGPSEGVSVNAIVVSVLEEFFKHLKKSQSAPGRTAAGGFGLTGDSCELTRSMQGSWTIQVVKTRN